MLQIHFNAFKDKRQNIQEKSCKFICMSLSEISLIPTKKPKVWFTQEIYLGSGHKDLEINQPCQQLVTGEKRVFPDWLASVCWRLLVELICKEAYGAAPRIFTDRLPQSCVVGIGDAELYATTLQER